MPTNNFASLWMWDAGNSQWYFHSPQLEAQGGLAAVRQFATSKSFRHFPDFAKTLDQGAGFWVNKF